MSLPVPGWYDDGQHPGKARWWDGRGWTSHFMPTALALPPYRIASAAQLPRTAVEGETIYDAELTAAVGPQPVEWSGDAMLVPEPDHPHDPGAVSVRIAGRPVGYLGPKVAETVHADLSRVVASGYAPVTLATAKGWMTDGRVGWRVQVALRDGVIVEGGPELVPVAERYDVPLAFIPPQSGKRPPGWRRRAAEQRAVAAGGAPARRARRTSPKVVAVPEMSWRWVVVGVLLFLGFVVTVIGVVLS